MADYDWLVTWDRQQGTIEPDALAAISAAVGGTITPPGGGGASELTPVTSNTTSPAGTRAGQLVGYLNTTAAAITVNGQSLAAGAWALFGWSGSAWVQMNTGALIPAATPVTATEPTFNDVSGTASDTYTIPTKAGVEYLVGGTVTAAGTYPGAGTVTITAQATSGYTLTGTSSWSHTFSTATDPISVTPTGPTWTDDAINGGGTWTTPTQAGVTYSPASGTATPGQSVTVTATAQSGYTLSGTTSWTHQFPATPSLGPDALDAAILALSPVGYWKLEDASGTTALDSSGNSRHGTYAGAYTLGGRDGAATFDGGYVEVPDNDDWSVAGATNGFSVFALAYTGEILSTRQHIIAKGTTAKYEWGIDVKESAKSGVLEAAVMVPGGQPTMAGATTVAQPTATWSAICVSFAAWTFMAAPAIYRGSDTPQTLTQPTWSTVVAPVNDTAPLRIAGRADNVGPWGGALRHVAIFRTQLSAAQVKTLMDAARADGLIP